MGNMHGANVEHVHQLAESMRQAADQLEVIQQRLGSTVASASWDGRDAVVFKEEWTSHHSSALGRTIEALGTAAVDLLSQAKEQEAASSDNGGGTLLSNISPLNSHEPIDTHDKDPNEIFGNGRRPEVLDRPLFNSLDEHDIVTYLQIEQGALGDCWLIASLKAIALQQPNLIKDAITENKDGTFTVRIYEDGKEVFITVTPDVITDGNGDPAFADNPYGSLWPTIYEKAVAQHYKGYDNIDGGSASDALELLTGKDSEFENLHDTDMFWNRDRSIEDISKYLKEDGLIIADTLSEDDAKGKEWYSPSEDHPTLVDGHSYVVESVNINKNTITIINPHPGSKRITMPYDEFKKNFNYLHYNPGK